jgi:epoxyqueuosine reductase
MNADMRKKIGSGEVGRFDQRNHMFSRPRDPDRCDPEILEMGKEHYGVRIFKNDDGYTLKDWAFAMGAWYLERWWGFGNIAGNEGLYEWYSDQSKIAERDRMQVGVKWNGSDRQEVTRFMKKAAVFLGASDVGVCKVDPRWVYSHRFHPYKKEHTPIEGIDGELEHAIVLLHEMNYQLIQTSPTYGEFAATGKGYSDMAYVAASVAHLIRDLGYRAVPCGNDTALSIPMAVDAGLGELGRNGLLISRRFGPRVRISKVFTDLPLVPDKPIDIGARRMCEVCGKCAVFCPGQAISRGEPSFEGPTISNNHGLYKWYINPEKCFRFWTKNKGSCGNCIRVCVFNKPDTTFHRLVRWQVMNLPKFDRFYLWADDLCGYGKQVKPGDVWK